MNKDTFCILPYTHTLIQTDGKIKLCCNSIEVDAPSITDQPFNELINNKLHVRVRDEMERGIKPKECHRCYNLEDNNIVSYRQEQNHFYSKKDVKLSTGLTYLDVRFNNTCNLKCVMCSSSYSSSWVEDERKLAETSIHKDHFKARVNFYDKNNFKWSIENDIVQSIKQNSQTLERIHFAGGEPLLSKQHNELLHYLIDTGTSKNLMISYNTNITLIDKTVIKLWNQFKHVKVFLSIDGTGDVLEYIRYPIKYSNVIEVFDLIEEHSDDNIRYVMHYTVNALNLLNVPDFIEYKMKLPYNKISPTELITIDCVLGPDFLAINVLPKNLVEAVLTRLSELTTTYPMHHMTIQSMHDKILTSYNTSSGATLNDTIVYCRDLDSIRNTDSSFILNPIQAYL